MINPPVAGLIWRKSTRSASGGNANCVEIAYNGFEVLVRDSKLSVQSPQIVVSADSWAALSNTIKTDHVPE